MLIPLIIVAAVLLITAAVAAFAYNRLIALRNRYLNAYAQIDVQAKRRYDLIPALVEASKGYLAHERQTLEGVMSARTAAAAANQVAAATPGDRAAMTSIGGAESALAGALGRFTAVAEAYPQLKANQQLSQLMDELAATENRISFARQFFNDCVMDYNTAIQSFPTVIVARPFGFAPATFFEVHASDRQTPVVANLR
ncbi:MAG TPA: LemA family protein [Tepidisphaeraceae bacterium]|nr:LemA family protein [Tepidisphaeraceae bacterium]